MLISSSVLFGRFEIFQREELSMHSESLSEPGPLWSTCWSLNGLLNLFFSSKWGQPLRSPSSFLEMQILRSHPDPQIQNQQFNMLQVISTYIKILAGSWNCSYCLHPSAHCTHDQAHCQDVLQGLPVPRLLWNPVLLNSHLCILYTYFSQNRHHYHHLLTGSWIPYQSLELLGSCPITVYGKWHKVNECFINEQESTLLDTRKGRLPY